MALQWIHAVAFSLLTAEMCASKFLIRTETLSTSGTSLDEIYIDANDVLYAADSESSATSNQVGAAAYA